jgi:hypothetical protein
MEGRIINEKIIVAPVAETDEYGFSVNDDEIEQILNTGIDLPIDSIFEARATTKHGWELGLRFQTLEDGRILVHRVYRTGTL